MVVSTRWFEFLGERNSATPFYLNLTSFLPQVYLFLTSFLPFLNLNLTSASSRISNHSLEPIFLKLGSLVHPISAIAIDASDDITALSLEVSRGNKRARWFKSHRSLNGPFRGAVFHHGGVPENCLLALMGRFPSLMDRFPSLMGRFPEYLMGRFPSWKTPGKQPIEKRGIKSSWKGWFWRMRPHPCFWYRRSVSCTLVPVFGTVVPFPVPSFLFWGSGEYPPKLSFWKPPFCDPQKCEVPFWFCKSPSAEKWKKDKQRPKGDVCNVKHVRWRWGGKSTR